MKIETIKEKLEKYNTVTAQILASVLTSLIFCINSIDFQFSGYIPGIFFTVAMAILTFRITISTSFTEKIPAKIYILENLEEFNDRLTKFILQSFTFGIISVIIYPIYKYTNNYLTESPNSLTFKAIESSEIFIILFFLLNIFLKLVEITIIVGDLISYYSRESISKQIHSNQ